jgi:hypothetical protein
VRKLVFCSAVIAAFFIIVLSPIWSLSKAQSDGSRFFPQTAHTVSGEFLVQYESAQNPLLVYGFPLTDAFEDEHGLLIQYFSKARFETFLTESGTRQIRITPIGLHLYQAENHQEPLNVQPNASACRLYTETGKRVCYAFLEFYDAHGGPAQFGLPISEFEVRSNRIVQYFENARFEWYPERPGGQRVVITDLGRVYFDHKGEDPRLLQPDLPPNFIPSRIIELQARAFVTRLPTIEGQRAVLYVIVTDQNNIPVESASVSFVVRYPDGSQERFIMNNTTNALGFSLLDFPISTNAKGIAEIIVRAAYSDLESEARTSFRVWY